MNKLSALLFLLIFSLGYSYGQSPGTRSSFPSRGVTQEIWEGINGNEIDRLTNANAYKNGTPSYARIVDSLDIGELGDNYGSRYSAYLTPPKTGEYVFWLAADDVVQLFLSTDETIENAKKIAELGSYSQRKAFHDRGKSAPVVLEQGKKYFMYVLHKEGGSDDHLAVAWSGPGMEREVITSKNLSPVIDDKKLAALKKTQVDEKQQQALVKKYLATKPADVPAYLEALSPQDRNLIKKAFASILSAAQKMPDARQASAKLAPYLKGVRNIAATPENPLKNEAARQLLWMEEYYLQIQPPDVLKKMGPHRLASSLGTIEKGAKPVKKTVNLNSKEGKHRSELVSTGFYALPGVPARITVPEGMENAGLKLQAGHHAVPKEDADLISMPSTTREFPITHKTTEIITPHGGLILLEVPAKLGLKNQPFVFENAIPAPRFVLGETTDEEWKAIQSYPAPWGELVSEYLTMIVPSEYLRNLANPAELMTWWNENNRNHEDFYAYYPGIPFRMHAMYYAKEGFSYWPLEWQPKNIEELLDVEKMRKVNSALYLHEHGHHGDFGDMEFGYISESTPNWAGYYMKSLTPFDWKDDPTVHLVKLMDPEDKQHNEIKQPDWYKISTKGTHHWSYPVTSMMLAYTEDFGWMPFKKTISRLRDREDPMYQWSFTGRRTDDQAKIDRYLIGLSEEAKRDVRPYFAHFHLIPSEGAAAHLDKLNLPKWDATHLPPPAVSTVKKGGTLVIPAPEKTALSMAGNVKLEWMKPEKGTLGINEAGDAVYQADPDFAGQVKLPYTLTTSVGASPVKYLIITVEP